MNIKKAQTATEYLIILAVVIVIALIVVGVLGGIPSIGGGASSNAASSYWRTAQIGVDSAVVYANGTGQLTIRNNQPGTITVTSVGFGGATNTTSKVIASGGTVTYEVNTQDINTTVGQYAAGDSYEVDVSIIYTDAQTDASYTFSGDGNRYSGTIAG